MFKEQRAPRSQGPAPSRKPWAQGSARFPCAPTQDAAGKEGAADASFASTAARLGSQFCAKIRCREPSVQQSQKAPCRRLHGSPPGVPAPVHASLLLESRSLHLLLVCPGNRARVPWLWCHCWWAGLRGPEGRAGRNTANPTSVTCCLSPRCSLDPTLSTSRLSPEPLLYTYSHRMEAHAPEAPVHATVGQATTRSSLVTEKITISS